MSQPIRFHRIASGNTPREGYKKGHVYFIYEPDNNKGQIKICKNDTDDTGDLESYSSDLSPIIEVEYSDLVTLRNSEELVPGKQYRITDYHTTTAQSGTTSADHQFDIIVVADDEKTLNENARACLHDDDTYFSEVGAKLEAWELKYRLDNDTSRFEWADTSNGKGVIYYMKDEWNNESPYDFKNIQFYRKWNSSKSLWCDQGTSSDGVAAYTFSSEGTSSTESFTDYSISGNSNVYSNVIKEWVDAPLKLNNICFFGNDACYNNTFGDDCYSNTFGNACYNNTFGNTCYNNTFGDNCYSNTFGNDCYSNTLGEHCYSNTFGNGCYSNTFEGWSESNILGEYCSNNTFGYCFYNSLGDNCSYNSFEDDCSSNTFGNNCESNTFGYDCINNSFGNNCESNTFERFCLYNTFGNNCFCNSLGYNCNSNTFGNSCGDSDYRIEGISLLEGAQFNKIDSGVICLKLDGTDIRNYHVLSSANHGDINWYIEIYGDRYGDFTIHTISSTQIVVSFYNYEDDDKYEENITFTFASERHGLYSWTNSSFYTIYTDSNSDTDCQIGDDGVVYEDGYKPLIINATPNLEYVTTVARKSNGKIVQYCEADLIEDQD